MFTATRCSTGRRGRRARGHRDARPGHRRDRAPLGRRRGAGHRRLRQRLLPVDQRHGLQRHRRLAGAPRGACFANPCFTQIHPTCIPQAGDYQSKLTLMSESLRNDGRIWVPGSRRDAGRRRDPRGRARLLPGAHVPELRQPGAPRRRVAQRQGRVRRGQGVGPPSTASTSTSPTPSSAWARTRSRALRQPVRDVRAHHRREPVRDAHAHLPGPALHDGRPVGRLQPDDHDPRPVRDRRGQLLRPRGQPARRQRADAGPGRRLLRAALHDRRLPRDQDTPAPDTADAAFACRGGQGVREPGSTAFARQSTVREHAHGPSTGDLGRAAVGPLSGCRDTRRGSCGQSVAPTSATLREEFLRETFGWWATSRRPEPGSWNRRGRVSRLSWSWAN